MKTQGELSMPAWLVGPGLFVPPIFLMLLACLLPRPVPPAVLLPRLDRVAATDYLEGRAKQVEVSRWSAEQQRALTSWRSLRAVAARPAIAPEELGRAQHHFRGTCHALRQDAGSGALAAAADGAAWYLTRAVWALPYRPGQAQRVAREWGGDFVSHLRATGIVSRSGRLDVHPLVVFALAKLGWQRSCGLGDEADLEPLEIQAIDLFRIRFGHRLPPLARLAAVRQWTERNPAYRSARAQAALMLTARQPELALEVLREAALQQPDDRALRNHFIFVQSLLQ